MKNFWLYGTLSFIRSFNRNRSAVLYQWVIATRNRYYMYNTMASSGKYLTSDQSSFGVTYGTCILTSHNRFSRVLERIFFGVCILIQVRLSCWVIGDRDLLQLEASLLYRVDIFLWLDCTPVRVLLSPILFDNFPLDPWSSIPLLLFRTLRSRGRWRNGCGYKIFSSTRAHLILDTLKGCNSLSWR